MHLKAMSQELLMNSICKMCSEMAFLILLPYLPGAKELIFFRNEFDKIKETFDVIGPLYVLFKLITVTL